MMMNEDDLKRACTDTLVRDDHEGLMKSLSHLYPDHSLTLAHQDTEWYRVGGLVDAKGQKITDHLREWVEEQAEMDDVLGLFEEFGHLDYHVTRIVGTTLFFVMPTGDDPLDFIQIEVDVISEIIHRPLFAQDDLPEDFEELIDPMQHFEAMEPKQISLPKYVFRQARKMLDLNSHIAEESNFKRFYQDWQSSSAFRKGHFTDYWVLQFSKYLDAFGETTVEVKPLSRQRDIMVEKDISKLDGGEDFARFIHNFDRKVGYPMAWYFFMVTSQKSFHELAETINEDLKGEYAYLADKDLKILKNWVADPYCFY